ncbi:MAG TPA: GNAT family N-acetyltransferase [Alphaproteobacteria bacterium]|nr:GNAT family N-acetyltransferase [Alphaproteobacteria bacterium]
MPAQAGIHDFYLVMEHSFTIRFAKPGDAPKMLECHREAVFTKAASHYSPKELEAWSPLATAERTQRMENEIVDKNIIFLVAEKENQTLGFAIVNCKESKLGAVYAKPSRGKNVGRALLEKVEALAQQRGVTHLAMEASLNAEEFYKAHGYSSLGRAKHNFSGVESEIVKMEKKL